MDFPLLKKQLPIYHIDSNLDPLTKFGSKSRQAEASKLNISFRETSLK